MLSKKFIKRAMSEQANSLMEIDRFQQKLDFFIAFGNELKNSKIKGKKIMVNGGFPLNETESLDTYNKFYVIDGDFDFWIQTKFKKEKMELTLFMCGQNFLDYQPICKKVILLEDTYAYDTANKVIYEIYPKMKEIASFGGAVNDDNPKWWSSYLRKKLTRLKKELAAL